MKEHMSLIEEVVIIAKYLMFDGDPGRERVKAITDEIHNGKYGSRDSLWVQVDRALAGISSMPVDIPKLNILGHKDGKDCIVQALEMDVTGTGKDYGLAWRALKEAVVDQVILACQEDDPSLIFRDAPRELVLKFARAEYLDGSTDSIWVNAASRAASIDMPRGRLFERMYARALSDKQRVRFPAGSELWEN